MWAAEAGGARAWRGRGDGLGDGAPLPDGAGGGDPLPPEAVGVVPGAPGDAPRRLARVLLARGVAWREVLPSVQPAPRVRWHRQAVRFLGRWRSRVGRPRRPSARRPRMRARARDKPTGGEERSAAALLVQLGLRVSARTVRRSMARETGGGGQGATGQRWATFVRTQAQALGACDCCGAGTATFRGRFVFGRLEGGRRRRGPGTGTGHPTAAWTRQQGREVLTAPQASRCVCHDRDRIDSPGLDAAVTARGVRVLRMPIHAPQATALCDRRLGSLRRKGLEYLIPFGEDPRRKILRAWRLHDNRGRPPSHLGPGLPEPAPGLPVPGLAGHRLPNASRVVARSILGGLHHEYGLEKLAA